MDEKEKQPLAQEQPQQEQPQQQAQNDQELTDEQAEKAAGGVFFRDFL